MLVPALVTAVLAMQAVPSPPRDAQPETAAGTAVIRGRVYSEETGSALRRASVTLVPVQPSVPQRVSNAPPAFPGRPRQTITDSAGRFQFTGVPSGSYRIRVSPGMNSARYVGAWFGSTNTRNPGRVIELADGQEFDKVDVPLRRGAAIAGRVLDDSGEPLSRVSVFVSRVTPGSGTIERTGGGFNQTDDLGRYRVFGLEPGDYVVGAEWRGTGGPAPEVVETEGFVTTFHPSAANDRDAARIRVRGASDLDGVDIVLIPSRTFTITGTVLDSQGRPNAGASGSLMKVAGGSFGGGFAVDAVGRFTMREVVPGDYTLVIQPRFGGPPSTSQNQEYAYAPVTVSADIENLLVTTQPAAAVSGLVTFVEGEPASVRGLRVLSQPGSRMPMSGSSAASVAPDGAFTLSNLTGPVLIRVAPLQPTWALKAVMLGATDITDTPVEFRKEHSGHLHIVITTRASAVEGAVTLEDGRPAGEGLVVVFPDDKAHWNVGSPRVRSVPIRPDGRYVATGLVGGRYLAVAVPAGTLQMVPFTPVEVFEALSRIATRVVVADDEKRVLDLGITKLPD